MEGFDTSQLLFFVDADDDPSAGAAEAIREAVLQTASEREWTVEPPHFVHQLDDGDHTLGGALTLYAPDEDLPTEIDRKLLDDVRALVATVARLSRELEVDFGFELDQDPVGWIEGGKPDESLAEGLIGEWERTITSRTRNPS